jgi:hypothetical protein
MEQYLTTIELSARIKMTPGTIRNLVWKKIHTKPRMEKNTKEKHPLRKADPKKTAFFVEPD